jgi:hypothetical protein
MTRARQQTPTALLFPERPGDRHDRLRGLRPARVEPQVGQGLCDLSAGQTAVDRATQSQRNKWLRYFAVFCRIVLALGFIPSGIVKIMGERFTGLPSNHPLGHYFDALYLTGSYYTFIGVGQLMAALLFA